MTVNSFDNLRGKEFKSGPGVGADSDDWEVIAKAKKRFKLAVSKQGGNALKQLEDMRFFANEQWEAKDRSSRESDSRPCSTVSRIRAMVHSVTNDLRDNRPAIKVSPKGPQATADSAKVLRDIINGIERDGKASIAYDTGAQNAVITGEGYWVLRTGYVSAETFDQEICFERVLNSATVLMDPAAKDPAGADAKWCFVTEMLNRDEFKLLYPDADQAPWEEKAAGDMAGWASEKEIRVAEYWAFETSSRDLWLLADGRSLFADTVDASIKEAVKANPGALKDSREVEHNTLHWYKLTGRQVLDHLEFPFRYIPVIRVVGDEVVINGTVQRTGMVRDIKDAQKILNFAWSTAIEAVSTAPKAPYLVTPEQIEGHSALWETANRKNFPYITYNATLDPAGNPQPPPMRQQPPQVNGALAGLLIEASQELQAISGVRLDATVHERTKDESGVAIQRLQKSDGLANFHFADNLAQSVEHTGVVLVDMIPHVYDSARQVSALAEDGKSSQVHINPGIVGAVERRPSPMGPAHPVETHFNPAVGAYKVEVSAGPSYQSQKEEADTGMLALLRAVPQVGPQIADLIVKNKNWPGAEELSARLTRLLPPQLIQPEMPGLPPQASAAIQSLQQQLKMAQMQMQQMQKALQDQSADRQVAIAGQDKLLAAKMAKIRADAKAKGDQSQLDMLDLMLDIKKLHESADAQDFNQGQQQQHQQAQQQQAQQQAQNDQMDPSKI